MELDIKQIMDIIPHRPPFLLVDRVLEMEPGVSVRAIKNVTMNEPFFAGHYPGEPIMPGVLIIEAMAQAGAIAILSLPELKGRLPIFGALDKAKFRAKVTPGDTLELSMKITKLKSMAGIGEGVAAVNGKKVCEGTFTFIIG